MRCVLPVKPVKLTVLALFHDLLLPVFRTRRLMMCHQTDLFKPFSGVIDVTSVVFRETRV